MAPEIFGLVKLKLKYCAFTADPVTLHIITGRLKGDKMRMRAASPVSRLLNHKAPRPSLKHSKYINTSYETLVNASTR
jgi:hypothetical protein